MVGEDYLASYLNCSKSLTTRQLKKVEPTTRVGSHMISSAPFALKRFITP